MTKTVPETPEDLYGDAPDPLRERAAASLLPLTGTMQNDSQLPPASQDNQGSSAADANQEGPPDSGATSETLTPQQQRDALAAALQLLRGIVAQEEAWKEYQLLQSKEKALRERREAIEAGDHSLSYHYSDPSAPALPVVNQARADLPKAKDPHVYKAKDRLDYEKWHRDCLYFFTQNPAHFAQQAARVNFGYKAVGETQKTSWDTWMKSELARVPQFEPTWANLCEKMLALLGSPQERRIKAFQQLKELKQKETQTPSEVLYELQPLWNEVEETNEKRMISEFINSLTSATQRHLNLLPEDRLMSLANVEIEANRAWRQRRDSKPPNQGSNHGQKGQSGPKGDKRARSRDSDGSPSRKTQKTEKSGKSDKQKPKVTCWNCGKLGHYSSDCRSPKKDSDKPLENSQGQKK